MKKILKLLLILILLIVLGGAGLIAYLTVTEFDPAPVEAVAVARSGESETPEATVTIASWNIGYGGLGKNADFVIDGGTGDGRPESESEFLEYYGGIKDTLRELDADVYLLQEVDENSHRSYSVNETTDMPEALSQSSAVFAKNYSCDFVPFPWPPIGKVHGGVLTMTDYEIEGAERIALPCPFDWPLRVANLKRCLLVSRVDLEESDKELVLVNLHLEAYDSGEGKAAQTAALMTLIEEEYEKGNYVIAGGDFNQTFPGGLEAYPVQKEGIWAPGTLSAADLPEGFSFAYDTSVPSCRSLDRPLDSADPSFQYYLIDGFILSPNVKVESIKTVDKGFINSDHNPLVLTVSFEGLVPEDLEAPEDAETRDFSFTIEGMEQTVSMTRTPFDLSFAYGPTVEMYMDTELFEAYTFEGEHFIVPLGSGEAPTASLHLACLSETADINAERALTNPGYQNATDEGMVTLGEYDAYCVRYELKEGDMPGYVTLYFIPWGDMTISISLFATYEAAEGMLPRLNTTARSIVIK